MVLAEVVMWVAMTYLSADHGGLLSVQHNNWTRVSQFLELFKICCDFCLRLLTLWPRLALKLSLPTGPPVTCVMCEWQRLTFRGIRSLMCLLNKTLKSAFCLALCVYPCLSSLHNMQSTMWTALEQLPKSRRWGANKPPRYKLRWRRGCWFPTPQGFQVVTNYTI